MTKAGKPRAAIGYAACALAGCLWSTGFLFGKVALRSMDSSHMVLYRFLFGVLALLPFLRRPSFAAGEWVQLLLASLLGIPVQFLIQFYGLSLTTVSHAALMVGVMPGVLALGATVFAGERLPARGWTALAASSVGVGLIVLSGGAGPHGGSGASLKGDLLILFSMVVSLGWLLLNRSLVQRHAPLQVTAWGLLLGSLMLAAWVVPVHGPPPLRGVPTAVWWALAASGVLCTAATSALWNWGMRHVPASRAGVFLNIEPALGSALGVWLLGERLGPAAWAGGGLIISAAVVLTRLEPGQIELALE